MPKKNPHLGSTLESSLREDGTYGDAKNQAIETAETFLRKRAADAVESDLTHYLDKAPDLPPDPEDELPRE